MPTNKAIKEALLKKLGCTPQAITNRVRKLKKELPMSTPDAVYIIAHDNGIKLDKHLDEDALRHIRDLISKRGVQTNQTIKASSRIKASNNNEIRFPNEFKVTDPILSTSALNNAKKMATVYPLLYVIESSMREVVRRVLNDKYGSDWWNTLMISGKLKAVKINAERRMHSESRLSWHQARGSHNIDYVDFKDLETIICTKQADFFPKIISPDKEWFTGFMRELIPSRNVVCHMNPLLKVNMDDLKVKIKRWNIMIRNNIRNIP